LKFKFVGYDKNGKKIKGKIEANSLEEAKLKIQDYTILEIKKTKSINFNFSKPKKREIAKIFQTLGLYLKASIPLKKAINLAKLQTQNPKISKFLEKIEEDIKSGKTFFESIKSQKIIPLPNYIIYSIQNAESSSNLDKILLEISDFLLEEDKISSKTTQALIYPLFIITISIILVVVMMSTIVPKIIKIFQSLHQELPQITKITISISNFISKNYVVILLTFLIFILAFTFIYKKSKTFKKTVDLFLLKIPLLNDLIISKNLARLTSLTNTLTSSGIHFINAFSLASKTIENEILKEKLNKALNEVYEGKKLSTSLKKQNFPSQSLIESISLIEETSQTSEILKNLTQIYTLNYQSKISVFLSLLEPVMILIVGGVIGFIVISMLLPIFKMNLIG